LAAQSLAGHFPAGDAVNELFAADFGIRQLHGRYVDAVFRKDTEAYAACFTEDAEWKIAGMHMRGREEIVETFLKLTASAERVFMLTGMPVLDIGTGTATGRIYVTEYVKRLDGGLMRTIGTYYDRYEGQGTEWRFRSRHWTLHYRGEGDFAEPFFTALDYGAPPAMPGLDEPPEPRRP
jgi:ketosteroid isomerase-like protein